MELSNNYAVPSVSPKRSPSTWLKDRCTVYSMGESNHNSEHPLLRIHGCVLKISAIHVCLSNCAKLGSPPSHERENLYTWVPFHNAIPDSIDTEKVV